MILHPSSLRIASKDERAAFFFSFFIRQEFIKSVFSFFHSFFLLFFFNFFFILS